MLLSHLHNSSVGRQGQHGDGGAGIDDGATSPRRLIERKHARGQVQVLTTDANPCHLDVIVSGVQGVSKDGGVLDACGSGHRSEAQGTRSCRVQANQAV